LPRGAAFGVCRISSILESQCVAAMNVRSKRSVSGPV
jgi:hypothetical protein